jgi:hypothetical protein
MEEEVRKARDEVERWKGEAGKRGRAEERSDGGEERMKKVARVEGHEGEGESEREIVNMEVVEGKKRGEGGWRERETGQKKGYCG